MPANNDSVWRAVKSALVEYGKQYPHTVAGKVINRLWGE
jgi:hypothetical protein